MRLERMIGSAPDYYENSRVYRQIQQAQADVYNSVDEANEDLLLQLDPFTATWGLRYHEEELGIPIVETDPMEERRSRIIAKMRGPGNLSASLIKSICESFTNGEVDVTIDLPNYQVKVTFIGVRGMPPNEPDLFAAVEKIIHAHMGVEFIKTYLTFAELESSGMVWNTADTYQWNDLERAKL